MRDGRVNYRSWLLTVLTWDGVLPACVALIPAGIKLILPNNRGIIEVISVTLPIAAFLLRFRAGKRRIDTNGCSEAVRIVQMCIFVLGILALVLVDCFLILTNVMPQGAEMSLVVSVALLAPYLAIMAVAMYPGHERAD
jgi:hypothetical protein